MKRTRIALLIAAIFLLSAGGCQKFYQKTGWYASPVPVRDKFGNYRAYLLYVPKKHAQSTKLVVYYVGSTCSNTRDYFGNQPENMTFMEEYADRYNFFFAVPYPIYEYEHRECICRGWVIEKEIDFIDRMIAVIKEKMIKKENIEIYNLGLSAGGFMAYYHAYLNNDSVKGVFSHGKGSEYLKEMIKDPSAIKWRLGLAHNRYDYPDIIKLIDEDYQYYTDTGIEVKLWKDCDDNRHSWSVQRTDEYLSYLFYGR